MAIKDNDNFMRIYQMVKAVVVQSLKTQKDGEVTVLMANMSDYVSALWRDEIIKLLLIDLGEEYGISKVDYREEDPGTTTRAALLVS